MLWSAFKTLVNTLLSGEESRLGSEAYVAAQMRLGVGAVQVLIPYYSKGIVTTFEHDDMARVGFASRIELPKGANFQEFYHIKSGNPPVRRPLTEYRWNNRHDLEAGMLNIGRYDAVFRYAIDPRGGKDMLVYPLVTPGYAVQVVWDAAIGRASEAEYADTDLTRFDEPLARVVSLWIHKEVAILIDRDEKRAAFFEQKYREALALLYSETESRLRALQSTSDADPGQCSGLSLTELVNNCEGSYRTITSLNESETCICGQFVKSQTEWVMVGDTGNRATMADTIAVATAIKAIQPEFIIHLGDAAVGTHLRPTSTAAEPVGAAATNGGAAHLVHDLLVKHYWNFMPDNFYLAFGESDLETAYGNQVLDNLETVNGLIGNTQRAAHQLWYTFAKDETVRFIVLNSGTSDMDANLQLSDQLAFVEATVGEALEPWIIVVFHRPARTSDNSYHPGSTAMKTLTDQLAALGVDLVVCGHGHNYERTLDAAGLMHIVCGLGGEATVGSATTFLPDGSQYFYNDKHGFLRFTADADTLQWELRTPENEVVDTRIMRKTDEPVVDDSEEPENPATGTPAHLTGLVSNASTCAALAGVVVTAGSKTSTTGSDGIYNLTLDADTYTLAASKDGYAAFSECITLGDAEERRLDIALSATIVSGMRIVLSWGEFPRDLDAHLLTPEIAGHAYHIYYDNRNPDGAFATLDVDDTASYGPETITIDDLKSGTYKFYVHNYPDSILQGEALVPLANCRAVVRVYDSSGLKNTITVHATGTGRYWDVCTIDGDTGAITEINTIQETAPS